MYVFKKNKITMKIIFVKYKLAFSEISQKGSLSNLQRIIVDKQCFIAVVTCIKDPFKRPYVEFTTHTTAVTKT